MSAKETGNLISSGTLKKTGYFTTPSLQVYNSTRRLPKFTKTRGRTLRRWLILYVFSYFLLDLIQLKEGGFDHHY